MDILTYINRMNQLYGNDTQVASSQLNIPAHLQHQFEGGQLPTEEFYQYQSIPQSERPLTGAEGGRVYDTRKYLQGGRVQYKPGGIVEPGVTHYATDQKKIEKGIFQRDNGSYRIKANRAGVMLDETLPKGSTLEDARKVLSNWEEANPIKVKWKEGQKIKLVSKGGKGEQVVTDIIFKTPKIEANFKAALADYAGENKGNWSQAKLNTTFGNASENAAAFVRSQNPELIRDTNQIFTQKYKTHLDDLGIKDWASATKKQKHVIMTRANRVLNPYERKGYSVARDQIAKNIPVLDKFEKSGQTLEDFYELVKDRTFKKNLRAYMKGTAGENVTEAFDQVGIKTKYKNILPKIKDHLEVWHSYENPGTAYKGQLKKAKIKKWSDLHTENMISKAKRVKKTDYANMLDLSHRQDLVIDQNISELGIERPEINRVLIKDAEIERNKLHRKNFELVDEIKKGNNVEKNLRLINENNARITKIAELTKGRLTGITINPDTLEAVKLKPSNIMGVDAGILNKSMKDLTVADKKVLRTQILPQIIEEARAMTPQKIASDLSGIMDDPVLSEKLATRMKNLKQGKQITKPVFEQSQKVYRIMIEKIGCPGLAAGGRASFQDGSTCYSRGVEKIKTGEIKTPAEKSNFSKLTKMTGGLKKLGGWLFGPVEMGTLPLFLAAEGLYTNYANKRDLKKALDRIPISEMPQYKKNLILEGYRQEARDIGDVGLETYAIDKPNVSGALEKIGFGDTKEFMDLSGQAITDIRQLEAAEEAGRYRKLYPEAQKEKFDVSKPMFKSGGRVYYDTYLPDPDNDDK